jgi:hypothetical protein
MVSVDYRHPRLLRDTDNDSAIAARWCGGWLGWTSRWLLAVTRGVCWVRPAVVRPVGRNLLLVAAGVPVVRTIEEANDVLDRLPMHAGMAGWVAHRRLCLALYEELAAASWARAFALTHRVRLEREEVAQSAITAANEERAAQENQESRGNVS